MNKVKALVLVAISVIALGGGVFTVSNAQAAIISEWTTAGGNQALGSATGVREELFFEPNTSVEMYDLVNVDGQTGNDSATEISSGGVSIPQSGQTMLDSNNIVKDDILSTTDADYTVPMQDGGIVIIGNTLSTFSTDYIGTLATMTPGTCIDDAGATHNINVPTTGGWYQTYNPLTCAATNDLGLSTYTTDLSSEEYSVVYNDAAVWQNGTTPYILDLKINIGSSYETGASVSTYVPTTPGVIDASNPNDAYLASISFTSTDLSFSARTGQKELKISFAISDSAEYGYAEAGKTPEEVAGHDVPVNLVFNDMEYASGYSIDKTDLYGMVIPYCEVKYNTDLTIDTANTDPECLTTKTTGVSSGDSDGYYNDFGYIAGDPNYENAWERRGYTYATPAWKPTEADALLNQYIMDQRTKVYDGGTYVTIMDSWRANGNGNGQTATSYQISTVDSAFTLYYTLQSQWYFDPLYSYNYITGNTIFIQSTEEPIVSMAKVQEDTGIDGKGVNDDMVAPGETVHYRLYAINSGFDGETGYRFYDDLTNLLEYTGVVTNVGVKKITGDNFSPFLAEYTQYMNDPTLGDIPACGSVEATYTCEDVTAITNSSAGAVVDITLNEALPTQTAYELSFDVVVGADYNGQTDKTITNTGYLTEPGCTITSGVPSSSCSANESVTIEYGSIALKIAKGVNDVVDSSYTPSEGIAANGDTYASSEEWLNYTLTITNASADGALNVAQDVLIVDDLTLDTNLSKIDPATIVVTSSIDGVLATTDYTNASTATKLDITLSAIEVDETMTITFKAQAL